MDVLEEVPQLLGLLGPQPDAALHLLQKAVVDDLVLQRQVEVLLAHLKMVYPLILKFIWCLCIRFFLA